MRKLIAGAIVAAALTVPATPAFAIHDGTGMPGAVCSNRIRGQLGTTPTRVVHHGLLQPGIGAAQPEGRRPPALPLQRLFTREQKSILRGPGTRLLLSSL